MEWPTAQREDGGELQQDLQEGYECGLSQGPDSVQRLHAGIT